MTSDFCTTVRDLSKTAGQVQGFLWGVLVMAAIGWIWNRPRHKEPTS
jgi:hypothetical protein